MLIIPVPLKIYFFSLTPITFYEFIIPAIPLNLAFDLIICIVGFMMMKVRDWELLHTSPEMNIYNMVHIWVACIMIALSIIVLTAVIMYWLYQCAEEKRKLSGQHALAYASMKKNKTTVNEDNTKLKNNVEDIEKF